jgi:hypothetical protein
MWGYVLVAGPAVGWFVWWLRRPHPRRSAGARSRDGGFDTRYLTVDDEDERSPIERRLPGQYDGD